MSRNVGPLRLLVKWGHPRVFWSEGTMKLLAASVPPWYPELEDPQVTMG